MGLQYFSLADCILVPVRMLEKLERTAAARVLGMAGGLLPSPVTVEGFQVAPVLAPPI